MVYAQRIFLTSAFLIGMLPAEVSLAKRRIFWTPQSQTSLQLAAPQLEIPFGTFRSKAYSCETKLCSMTMEWIIDGKPVFDYSLRLLTGQYETYIINGTLPDMDLHKPQGRHRSLADLGYLMGIAGWHVEDRQVVPAWRVLSPDGQEMWLIDGQTGSILAAEPNWWEVKASATVLDPLTHKEQSVSLSTLTSNKYLESENVLVYAPFKNSPRAENSGAGFTFSKRGADADEFDQVQAFYSATVFRKWLSQWINDEYLSLVTIRIDYPYISTGNAGYSLLTNEIAIGMDSDDLQNLARDFDVIAHEYGHHFIGNFVRTGENDAGILHEGFADYLVYAYKNKPVLTELATVTSDYLRSANVKEDERFDNPNVPNISHERGRLWSAILWQVRQQHGKEFDQVVIRSIMSLSEKPTLTEALEVLLAANQSLVKSNTLNTSTECAILNAAVKRGLATWMRTIDGSGCGLDIDDLAKESRDYTEDIRGTDEGPRKSLSNPCGVLRDGLGTPSSFPLMLAFLLLPVLISIMRSLVFWRKED